MPCRTQISYVLFLLLPMLIDGSHDMLVYCSTSLVRAFCDFPSTIVLKSPTGTVIGKSTASKI